MSKIICDVCGTAYPETAAQCPICGCAKPDNAQVTDVNISESDNEPSSSYTYVKGGRFSKANVRKRNKAAKPAHDHREEMPPEEDEDRGGQGSNRGLVICVIVLLLAIIAVVAYIAIQFFLPDLFAKANNKPAESTGTTPVVTTQPVVTTVPPTTAPDNSCTDLILSDDIVEIDEEGAVWLLNVVPVPENTEDVITYESSDPSIVSVTQEGRITGLAPGQAIITITCGDVVKECRVACLFETEPTEPPTEATTAPTFSDEPFELNREDITLAFRGDSWQLYDGSISKLAITWTSDNPNIATIDGGLVTAVGAGTTEVHGEYNGKIVTCIIRCNFS